jgi:Uma2 family endonuclease
LPEHLLTLEEYAALPEEGLYIQELSKGRLVREPRPADAHGAVVVRLIYELQSYLEQHPGVGELRTESGFVLAEDPYTLRGPDVAFVRANRIPAKMISGFFQGPPDIAIEVVSPADTASQLQEKVLEFLNAGAPSQPERSGADAARPSLPSAAGTSSVWVIYPESAITVAYYHDGKSRIHGATDALTSALLPGFELRLAEVLERP